MESSNCPVVSNNSIRGSIDHSGNNQDANISRKHHKTKQKRKPSKVSLGANKKTEKRTSKQKPSRERIKQEISEVQKFMATCNLQSIDNDHLSVVERPQTEREDNSHKVTTNFMQMTIDKKNISSSLQTIEETDLPKDEQTEDGLHKTNEVIINQELTISKETKPRNVNLEGKLAQNNESNYSSTIDLSSLNVTDNDITLIIEQVLRKKKQQYTQLILRDNALTSIGIKILVDELLTAPNNLKNLGLSSNPDIGDVGVEHLVRLLQTSRSLTLLALHNTGITKQGVRLLANVLCDTATNSRLPLEKLYISFNKSITDESLEALIQILEQNQTLKVLSLQHCGLSDKAQRQLRQMSTKKTKKKFSLLQ